MGGQHSGARIESLASPLAIRLQIVIRRRQSLRLEKRQLNEIAPLLNDLAVPELQETATLEADRVSLLQYGRIAAFVDPFLDAHYRGALEVGFE